MANKIPRLNSGARPSAVPNGSISNGDGAAPIANVVGDLADVGYKIAAGEEQGQAAILRDALEKKQAILDEVTASRAAGDYEESLVAQTEKLKKNLWENPAAAPDQLLALGREMADQQITSAPNTAVSLDVAQKTASRLDSAMREMHNWAQARQTQKAKGDLSVIIHRATAGAEGMTSLPALDGYIKLKEAELSSVFGNVLGGEAPERMKEMRAEMAQGWLHVYGADNPIGALRALKEKSGPLIDHLSTAQREAGRDEMKSALKGLAKTRDLNAVVEGISGGRKLTESFLAGDPDFIKTAYAQKAAIEEQRKAVKAELDLNVADLKELGIDPQGRTPKNILSTLDERTKLVDALMRIHREQTPYDAPDDPTAGEALLLQTNKALKGDTDVDLAEIPRQMTRLAIAVDEKHISLASAGTLYKTMALAMDAATENAEKSPGLFGTNIGSRWRLEEWRAPRDAGRVELNVQFDSLPQLSDVAKQKIRMSYENAMNARGDKQLGTSNDGARQEALRAVMVHTEDPDIHKMLRKAGVR